MVAFTSDTVLAILAYGSAIVATLRAGSRAFYLMEHDQIDVMDGPLILGPNDVRVLPNGTAVVSPLWELASVFQQSVRLALDPDSMEYQVISVGVIHKENEEAEPYSLSPFPPKRGEVVEREIVEMYANNTCADNEEATITAEISAENIVGESSSNRLSKSKSYLPRISLRSMLVKAPFVGRWVGQQEDETDDDESFSFDELEKDEWDFDYCMSTNVPYNTTSGVSAVKFAEITAYAPETFADLRSRFGIPEKDFRQSILHSGPYVSFQSNSKGAARAGGVFFFTRDGAYMIKTIKKQEAQTLLRMLPKYHKYMKRNGHRSLLTRFCGMYGVSLGTLGTSTTRSSPHREHENIFVVMNSVFPAAGSDFITERFDLKGSTVGRECSDEEREKKGKDAILKDLDLAREVELVRSLTPTKPIGVPKYGFHLGATVKSALLSQLRRDVRLLVNCGVMDYSLLVGVANMDRHQLDNESMRALELSEIQESRMQMALQARGKSREHAILSAIVAPIRILVAPPLFLARRIWSEIDSVFSSILTLPLPYYGAENPGVNGGVFSVLEGQRSGNRAIYFMGVIDFLQPWTTRKVIERRLKGFLGYDMHAISCVSPDEYATRFLEFVGAHVS
mmetsp:Transcript_22355/g.40608  ORF Transcript_22355/g.40608 Transcript_22355/m.40608 type:complete len:622 (-) Transcript_22355:1833-3698(-)